MESASSFLPFSSQFKKSKSRRASTTLPKASALKTTPSYGGVASVGAIDGRDATNHAQGRPRVTFEEEREGTNDNGKKSLGKKVTFRGRGAHWKDGSLEEDAGGDNDTQTLNSETTAQVSASLELIDRYASKNGLSREEILAWIAEEASVASSGGGQTATTSKLALDDVETGRLEKAADDLISIFGETFMENPMVRGVVSIFNKDGEDTVDGDNSMGASTLAESSRYSNFTENTVSTGAACRRYVASNLLQCNAGSLGDESTLGLGYSSKEPDVEDMEKNFDSGPTDLFLFIQQKKWKKAIAECRVNPEQAGTFIYRMEPSGKLRWRILPIHQAIIFQAPLTVVKAISVAFPQGTASKDDQGLLPIHLALKTGASVSVVEFLFDVYPESVDLKTAGGKLPLSLLKESKSSHREAYMRAWGRAFYEVHEECDFDINPTSLFSYLRSQNWKEGIYISKSEARTWVSRREGDGGLRWRMLPLHAAILFKAPTEMISAILHAYPQAANCRDDQGMLPIGLALSDGLSGKVLNSLRMMTVEQK